MATAMHSHGAYTSAPAQQPHVLQHSSRRGACVAYRTSPLLLYKHFDRTQGGGRRAIGSARLTVYSHRKMRAVRATMNRRSGERAGTLEFPTSRRPNRHRIKERRKKAGAQKRGAPAAHPCLSGCVLHPPPTAHPGWKQAEEILCALFAMWRGFVRTCVSDGDPASETQQHAQSWRYNDNTRNVLHLSSINEQLPPLPGR